MTEPVRDLPSRDPALLVLGATAAQVIGGLIAGLSASGRAVRRNHGGCAALADAAA